MLNGKMEAENGSQTAAFRHGCRQEDVERRVRGANFEKQSKSRDNKPACEMTSHFAMVVL